MSRFIDKNPIRIELDNSEDWIEIKKIPWSRMVALMDGLENTLSGQTTYGIRLVKEAIVSWNFKDDKGNPVEFKQELVDDLDASTLREISEKAQKELVPEKKS